MIKGKKNPVVGIAEVYEIQDLSVNVLMSNNTQYFWYLWRQQKNGNWLDITKKTPKSGKSVTYKFGETFLGTQFKIQVYKSSLEMLTQKTKISFLSEIIIAPCSSKSPSIERVILYNKGAKDVNKAKFNESLLAEARTVNLFMKEITFYLWEEGASESDKYKKPKKALVDKNGIAKVNFNLSEYASPQTLMSFFTGSNPSEKKFFVTAVYEGKVLTNKTPVAASNAEPKPAESNQNNTAGGILSKMAEVIAEGMEKIGEAVEKTKSPTVVREKVVEKVKSEICECEARVRAFMRMLKVKEGTEGEGGYTRLFAKKDFTKDYGKDMSTHPKVVVTSSGYSSSAAGAYQIMQDTYKGFQGYYQDENKNWHYSENLNYVKKYKIASFDQESQDKLCVVILKHNYVNKRPHSFFYKSDGTPRSGRAKFNDAYGDIVKMITEDNFDKAILTSSLCWASLPDAPYGQPTGTKDECKANYEKFLKEELSNKSDLYLKKGFLKEFGYDCCENTTINGSQNNNNNGKWHDPVDNPMCTIFTQSQTNGIINYAGKHWGLFGANARNGTRPHKGLDLFVIPGSSVYSCVKAEVTNIVDPATAGYGISVTLKILDKETFLAHKREYQLKYPDKEDKKDSGYNEDGDIFIFYGHLRKVLVKKGDIIDDISKPIALSGVSGVQSGGTCAPHVHFEIRDSQKRRCNPGYYIYYKSFDDQSQGEIDIQIKTAKNGKINEFKGKN